MNRYVAGMVLSTLLGGAGCAAHRTPEPGGPGTDIPRTEQAEIAWVAREGFCEPETVLALPDDTLLVSNVCGYRDAGRGYLSLLSGRGRVLDRRIVDGLDSPLGMALHGATLFVVDANTVRSFRWPDYAPLKTIALETKVANDIAVATDGTLYVTDTASGDVVQRKPDGTLTRVGNAGAFPGANGIAVRDAYLYVGGKRLWRVYLGSGDVETLGPAWLTDIDGIEFEADGTLQLTPVGGPLVRLRADGSTQVLGGGEVSSANHGYAPKLGLALIPTGFDNTVIAVRIRQPAD